MGVVINKNSNFPLISIITVVYNAEKTIDKTIKSVISQKQSSFEYIIIDGDSNDSTKSILNKYVDSIDFFLSEADYGIYDAMNKALDYTKGEWIVFLNSGDFFIHDKILMEFEKIMYKKNVDIFFGDIVFPSGKKLSQKFKISKKFFFSNTICHQSAFIKRGLFTQIGNFDMSYKIISDRDFFYRAYINNAKFEYFNYSICVWDPIGYSSNNIVTYNNEVKKFRLLNYTFFDIVSLVIKKIKKKLQ